MEIESIRIALRERNPWQAIDLGFDISRQFSAMLYKSYCLGFLLISLPIILILHNYPTWASLLVWYLKPLFEVGPQVLLSRRIFGEDFSNRQIINITLSTMKQHWWSAISRLRFSIRRSFVMPVFLLEGLHSEQRRKRLSTLSLGQSQGPTSLTILLAHGEILFYLVLLFIIYQFIPNYERVSLFIMFQPDAEHIGFQWLAISCWFAAVMAIAPFYICGGFALYLNKRIELEGWDLELSFKKIKNRLKKLSSLSCLLLFTLIINSSGELHASELQNHPQAADTRPDEAEPIARDDEILSLQELLDQKNNSSENILNGEQESVQTTANSTDSSNTSSPEVPANSESKNTDEINTKTQQEIQEILNNEPLVFTPQFNQWEFQNNDSDFEDANFSMPGLSFFLEVLLWGAVAAALIWLILKMPQIQKLSSAGEKRKKIVRQAEVFGVVLNEDDQHQDLFSAVRNALDNNDLRKALALLLSSALGELANRTNKRIPRGATENDCLQIAQKIKMKQDWLEWFKQLLHRWSFLAWGHKNISKVDIEQLLMNAPLEELKSSLGEQHG